MERRSAPDAGERILLWHGTGAVRAISDERALRIDPPLRQYDSGDLETHGGVYLTPDLGEALRHAFKASGEMCSEPGLVAVSTPVRHLVPDEDLLTSLARDTLPLPSGFESDGAALARKLDELDGDPEPLRPFAAALGNRDGETELLLQWLWTYADWQQATATMRPAAAMRLNDLAAGIASEYPAAALIPNPDIGAATCRLLNGAGYHDGSGARGPEIAFACELAPWDDPDAPDSETLLGEAPEGFGQALAKVARPKMEELWLLDPPLPS